LPLFLTASYYLHLLILTFIYIIASVSLRTITISGQFPLAHGAFMGIGAYTAGLISKWLGWGPWATIPLGAIAAGILGMLFGYPFSRLRSLYYAMGSLFFGAAVISIIQSGGNFTGANYGFAGIPSLFPGAGKTAYYYFFLGLTLVSVLFLYRFEFCPVGVKLKAIAQSYLVSSSVGINEGWYRVMVVGVGCFFVGLAGACHAHYNQSVTPGSFDLTATLWLIMYVLIGGINSFAGPLIGVPILYLAPEFGRGLQEYSPYISAGILLIIVYVMPNGLVGLPFKIKSLYDKLKSRTGRNRGVIDAA
jgi:branched-chain amino acid transport system permease protein